MRSRFSWFSISSFRALPSFSSVLIPQPILAVYLSARATRGRKDIVGVKYREDLGVSVSQDPSSGNGLRLPWLLDCRHATERAVEVVGMVYQMANDGEAFKPLMVEQEA